MSLLSSLLQQLIGTETKENVTERPCSNCPGDCVIASQGACPECEPFKKKLIDEIYHVNHLEEFYDRYEVTLTAAAGSESVSGTVTCPVCGARSANPYVCEYCDTSLAEAPASSGKIKVEQASDIPNPFMNAQDIIFERYETVTKKYMSSRESQSLLGELFEALTGIDDDEDDSLGTKMSESEIKEAAELYKMSIGNYLTGLDNGICLTLKGKKAADQQAQFTSAASEPASFGIPGIAGLGLLGSALIHQTEIPPHYHRPPGPTFQQGSFHQFPQQQKRPRGCSYSNRRNLRIPGRSGPALKNQTCRNVQSRVRRIILVLTRIRSIVPKTMFTADETRGPQKRPLPYFPTVEGICLSGGCRCVY